MYFTHSLLGAVASKVVIDKIENKFTNREKVVLWLVGITASVLPDFDLAYAYLNHLTNHRDFITHGMFIYLVIAILIYLLSATRNTKEFGRKFFKSLSFIFILGIATHFLLDFIVGGLVLLAPFSYQVLGFESLYPRTVGANWLLLYLHSPYMFIELFNVILFFVVLRGRKYLVAKTIALIYFLIALFSFVAISVIFF